ncbi:MAG: penicillin-insensitive murein endopeptidase [Polyangiaceae bacterium]
MSWTRGVVWPSILALVVLASTSLAFAGPRHKSKAAAHPKKVAASSVGSPNEGKLVGGEKLEPSKCLRIVGANTWGVPELTGLIERACEKVRKNHEAARLTVGDLSKKGGGDVGGHHSHESGRDVDLGFYLVDAKGNPKFAPRFAVIDEEGRAKGVPGARFDDAANWELVSALVNDSDARVLQIFVANPLRSRLLAYAAKIGAPQKTRDRAASLMLQPKKALPHDNHFHVRIACPKSSKECVDFATPTRKSVKAKGPQRRKRAGR